MVLQDLWRVWEHGAQMGFQFGTRENTKHHFFTPFLALAKPCHPSPGMQPAAPLRPGEGRCQARLGAAAMPAADGAVPHRLSPKRRQDGPKGSSARSSRSPSSPSPRRSASPHQNGHKGSAQNGRHSHSTPLPEPSDVRRLFLDHRSLPSPAPSAGPPTQLSFPLLPLSLGSLLTQLGHTGEMRAQASPHPHHLLLGAGAPRGGQSVTLEQVLGQPRLSLPQSHPSLCRCHPQGWWLGRPASLARVTTGLCTSLGVD